MHSETPNVLPTATGLRSRSASKPTRKRSNRSGAFAASCMNGDEGPGYEEAIREYADMLIGAYFAEARAAAVDDAEARAASFDDSETFGREVAS